MVVVLRALSVDDAAYLTALASDAVVRLWNPMTPEDPRAWVEAVLADERSVTFAVTETGEGRLLGTAAVFSIDERQGTAEVGYRVLPAERGRGVATAAVRALAEHAFDQRGLRRLALFHALANPASCLVAERAGFQCEGTLRESYVYGDGRAYDEHLHARLATDSL